MSLSKCLHVKGFTFIETMVAVGIFVTVIAGGNALFQYLSSGAEELQEIVSSDRMAQNALAITEDLMSKDNLWKAYLSGSPATADFHIFWNGTEYSLLDSNDYEGPLNEYSELQTTEGTKFYRKITITEKESWGLYEIKADVCFESCETHREFYRVVEL